MKTPKVSVLTITYNQERYIRQALDSILNQKVDFPIEVIVADDCSSDTTPDIIKEYAQKYPQIKPIFRKKNIGAINNSIDTLQRATGEYIALCEGDDFWLDKSKLQKQVEFLDTHPDYALCFHPIRVFFQNGEEEDSIWPNPSGEFTVARLLEENFIPTNSVVFRKSDYSAMSNKAMPFDWYLHLYNARQGKIKFMNKVMSVYRRHEQGLWWSAYENKPDYWEKNYEGYFQIDKAIIDIYKDKFSENLGRRIYTDISKIVPEDRNASSIVLQTAISHYPELFQIYIQEILNQKKHLQRETEKKQTTIDSLTGKSHEMALEIQTLHSRLYGIEQQLKRITESRWWRLGDKLRKIYFIASQLPLRKRQFTKSTEFDSEYDTKINVMVTMPWMTFGGAETLVYNYCRELKDVADITFVTGLTSENEWEYKFKQITSKIYHLPDISSDPEMQVAFISDYITKHRIHVLHLVHNGFMFDMLPTLKARHPKLKVILTLFNDRVPEYVEGAIKYQQYIDKYVSDNYAVEKSLKSRLSSPVSFTVIPNGINAYEEFNPSLFNRKQQRENLGLKESDTAVFFVGRLSSEKNPDIFVKAAKISLAQKHNKKLKFFLIGDGNMQQEIQGMIKEYDSDRVVLLGYQKDVAKYLSAADIFVLPSSIEGFPLSILEAMSMGVVVIASDVGAVSEVVDSGSDGYVVHAGSATEIAEKIKHLVSNPQKLNSMKARVREKVEKKYSNKVLGNNYKKLYKDLV